ncbi:MAG: DUF423 domain-containing protein [Sulfuricaulis sp.]
MPQTARLFLMLGAANAALTVMLGAFGTHVLKPRLSAEMLGVYQTAVLYHLFHALGLLAVGFLALKIPLSGYLKWSGWLMFIGIVLFSGSLYALSVSPWRWLGAVTPLGGMAFILAWTLFATAVFKTSV